MAGNDLDRDGLARESLDAANVEMLAMIDQRDGQSAATRATGAADAMHIVLGKFRQVVVEDVGNRRNVDPTCSNVRRDENPHMPSAQGIERAVARALVHVAV